MRFSTSYIEISRFNHKEKSTACGKVALIVCVSDYCNYLIAHFCVWRQSRVCAVGILLFSTICVLCSLQLKYIAVRNTRNDKLERHKVNERKKKLGIGRVCGDRKSMDVKQSEIEQFLFYFLNFHKFCYFFKISWLFF